MGLVGSGVYCDAAIRDSYPPLAASAARSPGCGRISARSAVGDFGGMANTVRLTACSLAVRIEERVYVKRRHAMVKAAKGATIVYKEAC